MGAALGKRTLLGILLGGFDAWKGATTGSSERAHQAFKTQTFSDAQAGKEKPYQAEIKKIDAQIANLQNDKVLWRGKMQMRWTNGKQVTALQEQRAKWVEMQMREINEAKSDHGANKVRIVGLRADAEKSLAGFQIALYFLMIVLTIPLANFDITLDLENGKRDGQYAKEEADQSTITGYGNTWQKQNPEPVPAMKGKPIGFTVGSPGNHQNMGKTRVNPEVNSPIDQGTNRNPGSDEDLRKIEKKLDKALSSTTLTNSRDSEFLKKWKPAVIMVIAGNSTGQIIQKMDKQGKSISRSTIKNIKRTLRGNGMIEDVKY